MGLGIAILLGALGAMATAAIGSFENQQNREAQKEANETNLDLVRQTNETNLRIAQEDRDFQLEMANTAHQREVADLKAAGLNPILSASGTGSAVTSWNTPTMQAGSVNPVGTDLSYLNSAVQSITNLILIDSLLGGKGTSKGLNLLNSPRFAKEFKLASRYS